jgi:transposase
MSSEKISAAAPIGAEAPAEIPERWSAARKTELVVRLLRGEPLDAVARDSQVPAHELEEWRRVFLDGGTQSLKKRVDPEERELRRVQAKLGETMMRLELAEDLLEKKDTERSCGSARDEYADESRDGSAVSTDDGLRHLSRATSDGVRADGGHGGRRPRQAGPADQ